MKILITAGGTTEPIDTVRSITNTSTGMLGKLVAEAYETHPDVERIYYICGKTVVLPQSKKIERLPVEDVASLESSVRKVLGSHTIDIIIHSMAVSDYRVKKATSASMLAEAMSEQLARRNAFSSLVTEDMITSALNQAKIMRNNDGKIRSDIDHLVLLMERTPKIISLFHDLCPNAVLVGFKLMDHVPCETLIDTAYRLLLENHCSFVLANDLKDIHQKQHTGYLVNQGKNFSRYETKEEIAQAIMTATLNIRRE